MSFITTARALRDEYVPEELYHRHAQLDHLTTLLGQAVESGISDNVRVTGPSGAGKTTLAQFGLEELEREHLDLRWGYVNCFRNSSGNSALAQMVRSMGGGVRAKGTPRSAIIDRLAQCEGPVIAVIDEVQMLADEAVLEALDDLRNVSVVTICIDENEWLARLDPRLADRFLTALGVELRAYDDDELEDILRGRIDAGLRGRWVEPDAVAHIVALAAGDARRAITLLRRAAQRVDETEGRDRLTAAVVDAARDDAESERRQRIIEQLSTHKRALFEIIRDAEGGEIDAGTLHDRYEQRVGTPRSRSMRRRYLVRLQEYELIEQDGNGR